MTVQVTEDDALHYGTKGMRWGVRKRRSSDPNPVEVATQPGKRVKARGGENQPPHEDAIRVAANRQKARKSSVDSLSTKELQELVNRMNLEQQYLKTVPESFTAKGLKFATSTLVANAPTLAAAGAKRWGSPQMVEMMGKVKVPSTGGKKKKK